MRILSLVLLGWFIDMLTASLASAQGDGKIPTENEVKALLQKESITEANWPTWKQRLTDWFGDLSRSTDPAYKEASRFVGGLADANGKLPPRFDNDHLAWYFLGSYFLDRKPVSTQDVPRAESAYRRAIAIAPNFARGHRNLALALIVQAKAPGSQPKQTLKLAPDFRLEEAERELQEAAKLDPALQLEGYRGMIAQQRGDLAGARTQFQEALRKDPQNIGWATQIVQCLLLDPQVKERASRIKPLVDQFPQDGVMVTFFALGLALDNRSGEAYTQLQRARSLGFEPSTLLPPDIVRNIETAGKPGMTEWYLWIMMWFGLIYAGVMAVMAGAGVLLAFWTRGTGALDLLRAETPEQLVTEGHVARAHGETVLARLYGFALMVGLLLFYAAIPFVIIGLLGGTALLLYLIFTSMDRIPLKLILIIFVVGAFSAWSVFKSIFTKPAAGGFGVLKTSADCPQLYQLLAEVSRRVDTDPVNEVFLSPGASIGVHQEGRGPFGMFGINKRVLTLGFCTLRFLTVGELKAILAHEYAHFSHSDTFYSRFIYQVHMSIENALYGMMGAGGVITYINPFYWFLWLYYKSYSLLAAGYSRSREFLADRMAGTLYGAVPFTSALTKVSTDGTLFEMTIYDNIASLLNEQKEYVNMYESFAQYRNEQLTHDEREKLYQNLLGEQGSLFASHPTFAERAAAIQSLPPVTEVDDRPALSLFDEPDALEKELTRFLTEYMAYIQYLHAQAAQQQS